jgi:hypothetical protein
MIDLGDRREDDTFTFAFTTYGQTGSPADATDLAVCCYKGIGEGESTAGLTLARHDDGGGSPQRLGLYRLEVDLDNGGGPVFYVANQDYFIVATAGTVDNVNLDGACIATFSIANRVTLPFVGIDGTVDDETTPSGTAFSCTGVAGSKALNFYENQTVLFTSGTLKGLAHFITESTDDAIVELTVQEMPNEPVVGDTFVILGTKGS